MADARFRIVRLEAPGRVDVPDGRWMLRGHANRPEAVVVIEHVERPRSKFRRRRGERDEAPAIDAVRLTVIDADPLDVEDPDRWLQRADPRPQLATALERVGRLLHLHAAAAEETEPRSVRAQDLSAALLGYGTGEEAADGQLSQARPINVPNATPQRVRRSGSGMGPDERLADLLAGRDAVLAAELLTLRAREDLLRGRTREAALQLRVAVEAAIAELEPWRAAPELGPAIDRLRDQRRAVADLAAAAVRGGLDEQQVELVRNLIRETTTALRRRNDGRRIGERLG